MKKIFRLITAIVCVFALSFASVFAYFEFADKKTAKIVLNARIPSAFGKLPDTPDNTWGIAQDNPFLIQDSHHLKNLELLNNKGDMNTKKYYFRLLPEGGGSLDMSETPMKSIGTESFPFLGEFDGNGKVIKNLHVSASDGEIDIGFFGNIGITGLAHDIILENPVVTSIGNFVESAVGHLTERTGADQEKCHIGVFCGHLDGNAYNISIKNAEMEIDSPAPTGAYMDYFSKYTTIGYCGEDAIINDKVVSDLGDQINMPLGDTGYFHADFYNENVGKTINYFDDAGIEHTVYNFLRGGDGNTIPAGSGSNRVWITDKIPENYTPSGPSNQSCISRVTYGGNSNIVQLAASACLDAFGIFAIHSGNGQNSARINPLSAAPSGQAKSIVNFVPVGSTYSSAINTRNNSTAVDLGVAYTETTDPSGSLRNIQKNLNRDIVDPLTQMPIKSFGHGIQFAVTSNSANKDIFNRWTGLTDSGSRDVSDAIYFSTSKIDTAANPVKPARVVFAIQSALTNDQDDSTIVYLGSGGTNGLNNVLQNNASTAFHVPNDGKIYVFEANVIVNREYALKCPSGTAPYFLYIAVGGQEASNDHINVERYASLPTIDYIYSTEIPVTHADYKYTKILPYFIYGSAASPVDRLRIMFSRTPGVKNIFRINAFGEDALRTRLGTNDAPVFDYIDRFTEDDFLFERFP